MDLCRAVSSATALTRPVLVCHTRIIKHCLDYFSRTNSRELSWQANGGLVSTGHEKLLLASETLSFGTWYVCIHSERWGSFLWSDGWKQNSHSYILCKLCRVCQVSMPQFCTIYSVSAAFKQHTGPVQCHVSVNRVCSKPKKTSYFPNSVVQIEMNNMNTALFETSCVCQSNIA